MLTRLGMWADQKSHVAPWTNVYGLARTLLALGTLSTLAASPTETLFRPVAGIPQAPLCESVARASLFCLVPRTYLGVTQAVLVLILAIVASGWRPRLTAIPHWWVSWSVAASIALPDGGDQVAVVLTLILLPVALTDGRCWHWDSPASPSTRFGGAALALVGVSSLFVSRLQVAAVYLHSGLAKLGVQEWRDGTAMYYWLQQPGFGPTPLLRGPLLALTETAPGVALLTWTPIALELALATSILMSPRARRILLPVGISFHLAIAAMMGLVSFAFSMIAALILLLWPRDVRFVLPLRPARMVFTLTRRAGPGEGRHVEVGLDPGR